jgi:hypothetical protein
MDSSTLRTIDQTISSGSSPLIQELSAYRQWVLHRADKVPLRVADLKPASPTNPNDWCSLDEALERLSSDATLGLGFVLSDTDPFTCIDLDGTEDINTINNHSEIFKSFNTYTEISPSGKGGHIWCKGWVPSRKFSAGAIEVYSQARYMTVTGNAINNIAVADRQQLLDELIASIDAATGQRRSKAPTQWIDQAEWFDDETVIQKASIDKQGTRFQDLFAGRWTTTLDSKGKPYPSQSEADQALCNHIAIYTDNMQQCGRVFRRSVLAQRKKAQRNDYLFHPHWGIVTKSFDQKLSTDTYDALLKYWESKQFEAVTLSDAAKDNIVTSVIQSPTGLLGDVATYIYNQSIYRNPEVAIAGGIALLSYLGGRAFNINGSGLNLYLVLLGKTSVGKEDMSRGISALLKEVRKQIPSIETYYISRGDFASAQGLVKQLALTPSMLVNKGEVGMLLQSMNAPSASGTYFGLLKACLMQLYHKSGHADTLDVKNYSDKDVPNINSPCLTLVSDSTHDNFYKALDEENVDEGLVARFTVVEVPQRKRIYNEESLNYRQPPIQLVNALAGYTKRCIELLMTQNVYNIKETPEAHSFQIDFVNKTNEDMDSNDSPMTRIQGRAHIQMLRLGALQATGDNPDHPEVSLANYKWAKAFIENGLFLTRQRFEAGEVGDKSLYLEQHKHLKKILKKYAKSSWSETLGLRYRITFDMWKVKAIPFAAIQNNCAPYACFRKDRDTSRAIYNVLREFEQSGWLVKADTSKLQEWNKLGNVWCVTGELEL